MAVDVYATESAVNLVSGLIDQGYEDYSVEAAASKIFASEALSRVADEALQISGGNGFMREYPYERAVRDCRVNRIFEGTNEVLTLYTALTGMKFAFDQLKELQQSAGNIGNIFKDPIKGFGVLSEYTKMRVGAQTRFGKPTLTKAHASLKGIAAIFEEETQNLTRTVDRVARKHGKDIIGKQFATSRIALIMIDLFVLAAMMSRVSQSIEENGVEKTQKEREMLDVFAFQARRRIRDCHKQVDSNVDEEIKGLSDLMCEQESYRWDIL